jgi:hypothetical protein
VRLPIIFCLTSVLAACGSPPDNKAETDPGLTFELTPPATTAAGNRSENASNMTIAEAPPPAPGPTPKKQPEPKKAEPNTTPPPEAEEAPPPPAEEPTQAKAEASAESAAAPDRPPVSNAQIARTLGRIGFPCGQVVSTERVLTDGGSAYRINCSSGRSYRGSTQRGRMRFRRWTDE